jgi:hypothetical protein
VGSASPPALSALVFGYRITIAALVDFTSQVAVLAGVPAQLASQLQAWVLNGAEDPHEVGREGR